MPPCANRPGRRSGHRGVSHEYWNDEREQHADHRRHHHTRGARPSQAERSGRRRKRAAEGEALDGERRRNHEGADDQSRLTAIAAERHG